MKTQKQLTDFTCDECGKNINNCESFPYECDWVYLYKFAFKLVPQDRALSMDKHFCSKECLKKFIINKLDNTLTALFG